MARAREYVTPAERARTCAYLSGRPGYVRANCRPAGRVNRSVLGLRNTRAGQLGAELAGSSADRPDRPVVGIASPFE